MSRAPRRHDRSGRLARRLHLRVMRRLRIPRLGECGSAGNFVRWQTRGCFEPTGEVEERYESSDLPDCLLVPPDVPQQSDILFVHEARRFCELAGVTEQRSGLRIQFVLGPCCGEFMTQMLIAGQAANCRRVEA